MRGQCNEEVHDIVECQPPDPHDVATHDSKASGQWIGSDVLDLDSEAGKEYGDRSRVSSGHQHSPRNFRSRLRTTKGIVLQNLEVWYRQYVRGKLLQQRQVPQTKDGRYIELDAARHALLTDERTGRHYVSNSIRSSRYTIWTFLPYQIWFQFTKASNFYFLIMGILQLIPGLSTTGRFTTILPLVFFLLLCVAREGYDDFRRYRLDKAENRRLARVLSGYRPSGIQYHGSPLFLGTTQRAWANLKATLYGKVTKKTAEPAQVSLATKAQLTSVQSLVSESDPWSTPTSETSPWTTVNWIDLKVGDIIELRRDEQVPADIVLLHADGRNGFAYIETMALDGETNLKTRQPPGMLAEKCDSLTALSTCRARFGVEDPNLDLYEFNGRATVEGKTIPLTLQNVVYRGCTLRNTNRAVGMIINTGEECKIRMNASKNPKTKSPVMQKTSNRVVWILSAFVVLVSVGCSAGYLIWTQVYEKKAWYLARGHVPFEDIFIAFVIMFNNLIPLALYISLEIVKFFQFILLHDIEMYDEATNTPMVSNTQTMFENLGQINYIFSDKTGTLTENIMRFRKFSVAGTSWLHNIEKPILTDDIDSNFRDIENMALPEKVPTLPTAHRALKSNLNTSPTTNNGLLTPPIVVSPCLGVATSNDQPGTAELILYLQKNPNTRFARRTRLFLLSLALCHTCFPEVQKDGAAVFQAASPDELALVEAAQEMGYVMIDRISNSITLNTHPSSPHLPLQEVYQILDVIEFSSKRKRMSIVVRFPDGQICIFCKGADSVIGPRLKQASLALLKAQQVKDQHELRASEEAERAITRKSQDQLSRKTFNKFGLSLEVPSMSRRSTSLDRASFELSNLHDESRRSRERDNGDRNYHIEALVRDAESLDEAGLFERCFQHIDGFASEGLRTLVYAYRFIGEGEYNSWARIYHEATTSLLNRQDMIERAGEMIEKDFDLAGATAIEDKLQKGVPETIDKLQRANMKIWMLTGDKRETAINIAHSAHLCKTYSQIITLHHEQGDIRERIDAAIVEVGTGRHTVIVIDGQTLDSIEHDSSTSATFHKLLIRASSVICCRASPSQKAAMVKTIRQMVPESVTLAIGDGGNDISMIQESHVGVGISGKEGLQAARVADFSIAQFRFLQRLLLVHGHWNYIRTAKNILWTFWKEMLFYSIQIMYTRWVGYTGTSLYESYSLTVWNTLFTSLCVMLPGIFEQDLSAETLLAVPELYAYGQQSKGFNLSKYGWWMILAGVQSQVVWWCVYGLYGVVGFAEDQGLFAIGDLAFSVCVVYINIKLLYVPLAHLSFPPLVYKFLVLGNNLFLMR
jgi:phospholipid-translocating ATPase